MLHGDDVVIIFQSEWSYKIVQHSTYLMKQTFYEN